MHAYMSILKKILIGEFHQRIRVKDVNYVTTIKNFAVFEKN